MVETRREDVRRRGHCLVLCAPAACDHVCRQRTQISSLHLPAPAALERVTGVFEMVGATALVLGVYARVAAVALALFVAFVSLMFVQFWSFKGPDDARVMVRNLFVGNLAAIGGLLYVAAVGAGSLAFVDL